MIEITKEYLLEEYINKNRGADGIAIDCKVWPENILNKLREFGIPVKQRGGYKRFFHNDNFFENWSHEMAYCLGFIAADGHIWKNRPILDIGLHIKDLDVLTYIRDCISPQVPISRRDEFCVRFTVTSQKIIDDLKKYNVDNKKTFNMHIDFNIPTEFLGDYTRGFFDGDGTVGLFNEKKYLVSAFCCASEKFLRDLRGLHNNIGCISKSKSKSGNYIFQWSLGKKHTIILRQSMYADLNVFGMKRKKDRLFCQ